MQTTDGNMTTLPLPMQTFQQIPNQNADALQIVALVKRGGKITGYQLSDGQVLSKQEGIELARSGGIKGVGVATRNGNPYLRSLPDQSEGNNLGRLPSVTQ